MFTSEKSSFEFFKAYSGIYGKSTALVTFLLILHFYLFDKNLLPAFLGFLLVFLNPYSRLQFYQNHHSNFLKKKLINIIILYSFVSQLVFCCTQKNLFLFKAMFKVLFRIYSNTQQACTVTKLSFIVAGAFIYFFGL